MTSVVSAALTAVTTVPHYFPPSVPYGIARMVSVYSDVTGLPTRRTRRVGTHHANRRARHRVEFISPHRRAREPGRPYRDLGSLQGDGALRRDAQERDDRPRNFSPRPRSAP